MSEADNMLKKLDELIATYYGAPGNLKGFYFKAMARHINAHTNRYFNKWYKISVYENTNLNISPCPECGTWCPSSAEENVPL